MDEKKIRKLLQMASLRLDRKENIRDLLKEIAQASYGDPFSTELDEFVKEKGENPQDSATKKLEEESELPGIQEISPQDKLEDKLQKEGSEMPDLVEESPQDKLERKGEIIQEQTRENVTSQLISIAADLMSRNKIELARKMLARLEIDIVGGLNELLKSEYLQRELYQAYDYLLAGPEAIAVQEHLREHLDQEMEHIQVLQRYITGLGEVPTLERLPIPDLSPVSLRVILEKDLEWELKAVADYTIFLQKLDQIPELRALAVDIENILSQEMEHSHDLHRWLKELR